MLTTNPWGNDLGSSASTQPNDVTVLLDVDADGGRDGGGEAFRLVGAEQTDKTLPSQLRIVDDDSVSSHGYLQSTGSVRVEPTCG